MKSQIKSNVRNRLVQAAAKLVLRQGFNKTTLADIAKEAKIPVGNVYYYFKTKKEVGEAIIEHRLAEVRMVQAELEKVDSPKERLCGFLRMASTKSAALTRDGCPVGTFCTELSKDGGPLAKQAATILANVLSWIESQFRALGAKDKAREKAVHLLSAMQGVMALANTFNEADLIDMEMKRLAEWIQSL